MAQLTRPTNIPSDPANEKNKYEEPSSQNTDKEGDHDQGGNSQEYQSLPCAQGSYKASQNSQYSQQPKPSQSSQEEEILKIQNKLKDHLKFINFLRDRIEALENQAKKCQNKETIHQTPVIQQQTVKPNQITYATKAALHPAINIDMDGNQDNQETSRVEPLSMDWAKVKNRRTNWKQRPELTESMDEKVTEKLEKYVEETMKQPESYKTKPQKTMTTEKTE